jgi:hypothetical protein
MKNGAGAIDRLAKHKHWQFLRLIGKEDGNVYVSKKGFGRQGDLAIPISPSFGISLVLFFFLLHFLHHLAMAVAMHYWPCFVFAAKGITCRVEVVIRHHNISAKGLREKSDHQYQGGDRDIWYPSVHGAKVEVNDES